MKNIPLEILAGSLIILILVAGVFFVILSARKQRLKQELKEANYQTRLHEATLTALRSQMNPHFIFNCLNSIKYFTEQNDSEAASAYLSKFAKIIRNTLDNARREKVTLAEEIESLELYLALEAMRFKSKLDFLVTVDKNVDADFIELPPMILQPYAENAIWHGLMPKESGGRLEIHISQEDDNNVFINIRDNGIGRAQSAARKAARDPSHQSAGTIITSQRLDLINERQGGQAGVKIVDLYDTQNNPSGTEVKIKLPLR